MADDIHFLERSIERIEGGFLADAVELYQDPERVAFILAGIKRPDAAQRIAFALGPADSGPYVVVAPDGHFVTCLAEGMTPTGLHVVPRERLAERSARWFAHKAASQVLESQSDRRPILTRILQAGRAGPSREDMLLLLATAPVMGMEVAQLYEFVMGSLWSQQGRDVLESIHLKRRDEATERFLALFAKHWWASAWLAPAVAVVLRDLRPDHDKAAGIGYSAMVRHLFRGRSLPHRMAAAWFMGYLGRPLLAELREQYRSIDHPDDYVHIVWGLLAIAIRSKNARTEIAKLLAVTNPSGWEPGLLVDLHQAMLPTYATIFERCAEHDAGLFEPEGGAPLTTDPAVAQAAAAEVQARGGWVGEGILDLAEPVDSVRALFEYSFHLGWLVSGDFALALPPASAIRPHKYPDHVAEGRRILTEERQWRAQVARLQQPKAVDAGRNDPCPCGSGKKYKKCCLV